MEFRVIFMMKYSFLTIIEVKNHNNEVLDTSVRTRGESLSKKLYEISFETIGFL